MPITFLYITVLLLIIGTILAHLGPADEWRTNRTWKGVETMESSIVGAGKLDNGIESGEDTSSINSATKSTCGKEMRYHVPYSFVISR